MLRRSESITVRLTLAWQQRRPLPTPQKFC